MKLRIQVAAMLLLLMVVGLFFLRSGDSRAPSDPRETRHFQGELIEPPSNSTLAALQSSGSNSNLNASRSNTFAAARLGADGATPSPTSPALELSEDDVVTIGFDRLSAFTYELPEEDAPEVSGMVLRQVPEAVRALHNRRIALKGFMLPLRLENGLATQLLMLRDQSLCCFGTVPRLNEWVNVTMQGKGVRPVLDQPITLFGRLKVAEVRENGFLVGIYAMEGEEVAGPLDL